MTRRRMPRLSRVAAAASAAALSTTLAATLTACEGTPAASQVTVIAGEQHLTFSPGPGPTGSAGSTPPAVAFSTQPAGGGSKEQDIEFRAGTMSLSIASVEVQQVVGPRDFSVVSDGCSGKVLAPGQACAVKVRFAPLATGPQDANLIFNLGGGIPALRLNLEGVGSRVGGSTISPTPTPTKTTATPTPTPTKSTPKSTGFSPSPAKSWIFMK